MFVVFLDCFVISKFVEFVFIVFLNCCFFVGVFVGLVIVLMVVVVGYYFD